MFKRMKPLIDLAVATVVKHSKRTFVLFAPAFPPVVPKTIRILNPLPGGTPHVGPKHAQRYVHVGRAEWVSADMIRFNEQHPQYQEAVARIKQSAEGYDQRGMLTRKEIRHIPVLFPERLR
jgi:hypothetical protein